MKKFLAIVLTLAMLLSSTVFMVSAKQVVTEHKDVKTYWNFPAGNYYNPVEVGNQGSDFDVEMDIKLDTAEAGKGLYGWDGLSVGPVFTTNGVGVGTSATPDIAGSYEVGRWYHVKWANNGDNTTTIYVDGASVGTVNKTISLYEGTTAFWNWQVISIDNLRVGSYYNDMEDKLNDGQGAQGVDETVTYSNENVTMATRKFWNFPAGNYYNPVEVGGQGSEFDVEMDIRLDTAEAGKGLYGWDGLSVGPVFTTNGVGVGTNTTPDIAGSYEVGRWYHVKWANNGDDTTTIYVDGAEVGTVDKTISLYEGTTAFWNWQVISIDNLRIGSYFNDMEDKLNDGQGASGEEDVEVGRYDLGLKFWNFPAGNYYNPVEVGNQGSDFDVEMDIKLDTAEAGKGLYGWDGLSVGPVFTTNGVGVGTNTTPDIAGSYEVNRWYHVKWDNNGNGTTTIYVDDVKVGTVNKTISLYEGTTAFWNWQVISIDNLRVGSYFNDMEDALNDGQGASGEYDLGIKEDSLFNHFETKEVGGDAVLMIADNTSDSAYYYISGVDPNGKNYILNFDLALIANPNSRGKGANAEKQTFMELWTDVAAKRLKFGEVVGLDDDLRLYDWGELKADNFHNITIVMNLAKKVCQLYIDKELAYETDTFGPGVWEHAIIGNIYNASAILDNVQLMTTKYEQLGVNLGEHSDNVEYHTINLDAKCSGRDTGSYGGHIPGESKTTKAETCTEKGIDTIYCAVCGEACATREASALGHNWPNITNGQISSKPNAVKDGVCSWYCKRGCGAALTSSLPSYNEYEGEIWIYMDFETPELVTKVLEGFKKSDKQTVHNGYGEVLTGSDDNYNDIYNVLWKCPWNYSVTFDFKDVSVFDTNDTKDKGHTFYFWFGGDSGIAGMAGYDFDNQCYYIKPDRENGGGFDDVIYYEAPIADDEWHTFTFIYNVTDEDTAYIGILVDGEQKAAIDDPWDAFYAGASSLDANKDWIVFRNFGVAVKMDNLVFGSSDFRWIEEPAYGDLNGDGRVSSIDLLCLQLYLADVYADEDIIVRNADVNGDGQITAEDYIGIKNIILGVN